MNSWKPTYGLGHAETAAQDIDEAMEACKIMLTPDVRALLRHRTVEIIAAALDQALEDGSEMALVEKEGPLPGSGDRDDQRPIDMPSGGTTVRANYEPRTQKTMMPYATDAWVTPTEKSAPKKRGPKKGSKRKPRETKHAEAGAE